MSLCGCGAAGGGDGDDLVVTPGGADDEAGGDKRDDLAEESRVELKATLAPSATERARERLRLSDDRSEERGIWFYDTPALDLFEAGAVLRARDVKGDDDDSTVKIRPLEAADVDPSWFALDDWKCEIDRLPDRQVSSCSLTVVQGEDEIEEVAAGERAIDKLFSSKQEELLAAYGPAHAWDDLVALGPIPSRVWKLSTKALPAKLTAELWTLPDGDQILELSMKVEAPDADDAQADLLEYLAARGLELASDQETKTRRALEALTAAAAR
jgi:hypothetical protein